MEYVAGALCGMLVLFVIAFFGYGIAAEIKRERSKNRALSEGESLVAWVLQAPPFMYEPGKEGGWPAHVLVSFRGPQQATPEQLSGIAEKVVELSRRPPRSATEAEVLAIMSDTHYRPEVRDLLPTEFTGGPNVWLCQVVIQRDYLPERYLTLPYVYCKAIPGPEGWVWMTKYPEGLDTADGLAELK